MLERVRQRLLDDAVRGAPDELGNGEALRKELRSLNVGVRYWVAIEAFNESGVSRLSRVVPVRSPTSRR